MRARFAALFVVATACTFPDITIVQEDGGGAAPPTTANTGGAGGAAATTSTESTSMTTTSSASNGGGGMGGTGGGECPDVDGTEGPSILCGGTDCDDDGDGVMVEFEGCCTAPGCDCVDSNPEVFPGQTAWFGVPWDGDDDYDYDCSFFEEPRWTTECPQGPLLGNCSEGKALAENKPCGQTGSAKTCSGILGSCTPSGSSYSILQECH